MNEQSRSEIRTDIWQQLQNGVDPARIFANLKTKRIPEQIVREEMGKITKTKQELVFLPLLREFLGQQPKLKVADTTGPTTIWDPAQETITPEQFNEVSSSLRAKYDAYQQNPGSLKRNLGLAALPALIGLIIAMFNPQVLMYALIGFIPIVIYIAHVFKIQRDLVKMAIAEKYDWIYSPDDRRDRWMKLVARFPELFRKGNKNQNLQDEFWGTFSGDRQKVNFWSGIFQFTVETRDEKGRKHDTVHTRTIFALELNRQLQTDFRLEPAWWGSRLLHFLLPGRRIHTESAEFNKRFAVYFNGKKMDQELSIVKLLSPSVQVRLLEMAQREGKFSVQFKNDAALYMFHGKLLKHMKTNFFRKVELDPRDQQAINDRLNSILDISSDIVPYLD